MKWINVKYEHVSIRTHIFCVSLFVKGKFYAYLMWIYKKKLIFALL